jgi:hypothetical protein
LAAPTLRLLQCLRFSKFVTAMHFDGPIANGRANGQLFYGEADEGAHTFGLPEIDCTALALFEEFR